MHKFISLRSVNSFVYRIFSVYIPIVLVLIRSQAIRPRRYTMSQSNEICVTEISATDLDARTATPTTREAVVSLASTRDSGRVRIGGGMMHFHNTKDAGRVHFGGGMMRF